MNCTMIQMNEIEMDNDIGQVLTVRWEGKGIIVTTKLLRKVPKFSLVLILNFILVFCLRISSERDFSAIPESFFFMYSSWNLYWHFFLQ